MGAPRVGAPRVTSAPAVPERDAGRRPHGPSRWLPSRLLLSRVGSLLTHCLPSTQGSAPSTDGLSSVLITELVVATLPPRSAKRLRASEKREVTLPREEAGERLLQGVLRGRGSGGPSGPLFPVVPMASPR